MTNDERALATRHERASRAVSEFAQIVARADAGDEEAIRQCRAIFRDIPELMGSLAELQAEAEQRALERYAPGAREVTAARLRQFRTELVGDCPTPLDALLAGRVVLDWLAANEADRECGTHSVALAEFYDKRADQAHRRLMRSAKTMAQVRALLVPIQQINIAKQQVVTSGDLYLSNDRGDE